MSTVPMLIESLRSQTNKDFEVHFCDGGSTDGFKEFIEGNPDLGFAYSIHYLEDKGMRLSRLLNKGIKAARGEYCLFVMADSFLEQDYLEILEEYARPDRLVCGLRIQIAEVNGKMEGVDIDWRVKKNLVPQFPTVVLSSPWLCLTGNGLTIPTEAFRKYGGWDENIEGYGGDDNEIIARLFFKSYLCWSVPDLRLYHHWHKSKESSHKNSGYVIEKIKQYEH